MNPLSNHVLIRANSIDYALSLVNRGRELIAKYSPQNFREVGGNENGNL